MKNPKPPTPVGLTLDQIMQHFATNEAARVYLEGVRWPEGPNCPHCGNVDTARIYKLEANPAKKIRGGLYECAECSKQFTVTVGTIFEDSKIPLRKWLCAFYLLCSSKKGISALQIQRQLGLGSYRTAWFMMHRIRHALRDPIFADKLGGEGKVVEVDETYFGPKVPRSRGAYQPHKTPVVALVERGGNVRSRVMEYVDAANIKQVLDEHVDKESALHTDESAVYRKAGNEFASHGTVNHFRKEYARTDASGTLITSNTVEGYFGVLKRGLEGVYQRVEKHYLPQYLAEFDFRYNTRKQSDGSRTIQGIRKVEGKRLTLRKPKAPGQ
jgi:transposase-like protein